MKTKIIVIIVFFYNFTAQPMNENKKTKPMPIKPDTSHQVTSSYYNKLLAMLSGESWDSSSLNYRSSNIGSLEDVSHFTETDVDMSGSIAFDTPPTSPRKNIEQQRETIHETHKKRSPFFWLCCCCFKDNSNKQTTEYKAIK